MTNDQVWELIARKLSAEATPDELIALDRHLKNDPELAHKVQLYDFYFQQSKSISTNIDEKHRVWKNLRSKLREQYPGTYSDNLSTARPGEPSMFTYTRYKRILAVAASVLLIASVAIYYTGWSKKDRVAEVPTEKKQDAAVLQTEAGKRLKKVLPDGTTVWLNSESRLTYNSDFGKVQREIILTGEAFFEVAHNTKVPLTVHVKGVNILVTGTAFNVRSYPESNEVETALIRGSVELTNHASPGQIIRLRPNEKITINLDGPQTTPSLSAVQTEKAKESTSNTKTNYQIKVLKESALANVIPEVSWVDNVLVFDNEPFEEVINKMEKWYNVDIQVNNQELRLRRFSGVFNNEDIEQALQALQIIIPFHFEQNEKTVIIK